MNISYEKNLLNHLDQYMSGGVHARSMNASVHDQRSMLKNMMRTIDRNEDGKISNKELQKFVHKLMSEVRDYNEQDESDAQFKGADKNCDGVLSKAEFKAFMDKLNREECEEPNSEDSCRPKCPAVNLDPCAPKKPSHHASNYHAPVMLSMIAY